MSVPGKYAMQYLDFGAIFGKNRAKTIAIFLTQISP